MGYGGTAHATVDVDLVQADVDAIIDGIAGQSGSDATLGDLEDYLSGSASGPLHDGSSGVVDWLYYIESDTYSIQDYISGSYSGPLTDMVDYLSGSSYGPLTHVEDYLSGSYSGPLTDMTSDLDSIESEISGYLYYLSDISYYLYNSSYGYSVAEMLYEGNASMTIAELLYDGSNTYKSAAEILGDIYDLLNGVISGGRVLTSPDNY